MTLDTIRSDFAFLDDWEDRYRYVIELGRGLPPLPEAYRTYRHPCGRFLACSMAI
jgi:cysteine desulfuration protein SufE